MKYIYENLKQVPPWRLIIAAVLLFGISLESNTFLSYSGGQPTFQEMAVNSFNRIVVFSQYLIFLLIVADFGFKKHDDANTARGSFVRGIAYLAFVCLLFVIITMAFNLLVLLIKCGAIATTDIWNAMAQSSLTWISPSLAMGISALFFYLRFLFVAILIYTVNQRCTKIPYGFAAGLAFFMFEMIVCFSLGPFEPTGLFPFEHAYLEYALNLTAIPALDITISIAYWGVLILIVRFIDYIANKPWRRKAKDEL